MVVMVCDDSKAMRMIVRRTLRQAGFGDHKVVEASNGKEGLDTVRGEKPDIVLTDWNMPEMTGIEMLETLRKEGNRTRVGFVTSVGTAEMQTRAAKAGASFFITKPFTADTFKNVLSRFI